MKLKQMFGAVALALFAGAAQAQHVGVAMAQFDNNFLTILRGGIESRGAQLGLDLQFEDAQNDISRQLSQVENFVSAGVDAIIVVAVDSDLIPRIDRIANAAGIPVINVNREPPNIGALGPLEAFVGSRESEAGTIQARAACEMLARNRGDDPARGVILAGDLFIQAGRVRTQMVEDFVKTPECDFVTIEDKQVADWSRTKAADLVINWISSGLVPDVIFANNDEMAIGAAQALRSAGIDPGDVVVAGIDATPDALAALQGGDLDITVFQDAKGQGARAAEVAKAMAAGDTLETSAIYIPFELVTVADAERYIDR